MALKVCFTSLLKTNALLLLLFTYVKQTCFSILLLKTINEMFNETLNKPNQTHACRTRQNPTRFNQMSPYNNNTTHTNKRSKRRCNNVTTVNREKNENISGIISERSCLLSIKAHKKTSKHTHTPKQ